MRSHAAVTSVSSIRPHVVPRRGSQRRSKVEPPDSACAGMTTLMAGLLFLGDRLAQSGRADQAAHLGGQRVDDGRGLRQLRSLLPRSSKRGSVERLREFETLRGAVVSGSL